MDEKMQFLNNVIVEMTRYLTDDTMQILEKVLTEELVTINMERITTLPVEVRNSVDERNRYVIQLFVYKKKKLAEGTMYSYLNTVKRLVTLIEKPLDDMDTADIYYYLNWYEMKNVSRGGKRNTAISIDNERRNLSAFFTWMRKEKMRQENPVEGIEPMKIMKKPIDYFTAEEISRLRDGCTRVRDRAIIEVLRSTGARVGEVVAITRDMIEWETGDIMIRGEKGGRYRPIYLDAEARYHLWKYLRTRTDDNPSIFVQIRKPYGTLSRSGIRMIMKEVAANAGLEGRVYPHKMRKTLGMDLKNKGIDIGIIQEVMGHASPAVTAEYYAQSTAETLRNVRKRAA